MTRVTNDSGHPPTASHLTPARPVRLCSVATSPQYRPRLAVVRRSVMPEARLAVLFAASLAGSACSPARESAPPAGRDLTLAAAPAPDAVLGSTERVRPSSAPAAPALVAAPTARPRVVRRPA